MATCPPHPRRGVAAVVMVVMMLLINVIILSVVLGGSRDHHLTERRVETIQAFYAAEGGMNMAVRELAENTDEDGDGTVGTISDDSNDANDPTLGGARLVVTATPAGTDTTLLSEGRSGVSTREIELTGGSGSSSNIAAVAGTGALGSSGDGGPAISARLNRPEDVAVNAAGNIYIADAANHKIRMVNTSTGVITTVAGTGSLGSTGDGGLATAAKLKSPDGVAIDSNGDVYIADTGNNKIRKVDVSTGVITTFAGTGSNGSSGDGGPATSAKLKSPDGVALDGDDNLYIADTGNRKVRRVDASTGIITTFAGTGSNGNTGDGGQATSAKMKSPAGVAVDLDGNVYIADYGNHNVRRVDASTGGITTVAGTGSSGDTGDGSLATSAKLSQPDGVLVDDTGNVYIADTGNNKIRKIDAVSGIITTMAGTGATGDSGDGGAATLAQLDSPEAIAQAATGEFYVADTGNHRIRKIEAGTGGLAVAGWGELQPQ